MDDPGQIGLLARLKIITQFINSVGVPMFLLLVVGVVTYGTWAGYIESPIATKVQLEGHEAQAQQLHRALLNVGNQQVEVLKGIKKEFRAMRCERQITMNDKVDCLSKLSREPDEDSPTHRRYRLQQEHE